MAINNFTAPSILNAIQYPEPTNSVTNARNQFTTAFTYITNQLNSEVTTKLSSINANTSGADQIGFTPINGVIASNTIQTAMGELVNYNVNTYLSQTNAVNTYLSIANATTIYLSQANAVNTYLSIANANTIYLSQTNANTIYLSQANASNIYMTISNSYTKTEVNAIATNFTLGAIPDGSLEYVKFSTNVTNIFDSINGTLNSHTNSITNLGTNLNTTINRTTNLETNLGLVTNRTTNLETNLNTVTNNLTNTNAMAIDVGRYSCQFAFTNTVDLVNTVNSSGNIGLVNTFNYTYSIPLSGSLTTAGLSNMGWKFSPLTNLSGLQLGIGSRADGITNIKIIVNSNGAVLNTVTNITANSVINIMTNLTNGVEYKVMAFGSGTNVSSGALSLNCPFTINDGLTNVLAVITDGSEDTTSVYGYLFNVNAITDPRTATGTVKDTITTNYIEKFGNLKINASNISANSIVTVTITDTSNNVLINATPLANGQNYVNLNNINTATYTNINTLYTINRNTTSDDTPVISKPSVTWLGN